MYIDYTEDHKRIFLWMQLEGEVRNWDHIEVTTILMEVTLENPVQSPY